MGSQRLVPLLAALMTATTTQGEAVRYADTIPEHEEIARRLVAMLDVEVAQLAPVLRLYNEGRHREALEAWRNLKVRELRSMPFGQVAWHGSYVSDLALGASRWLVGGEGTAIVDTWGLRGKPGETGPINWIAELEVKGGQGANYGWWRGPYTDLVGAYYRTHDDIFLRKWFEVTADFHTNQKRMMATD